jgi:hypothetical protein
MAIAASMVAALLLLNCRQPSTIGNSPGDGGAGGHGGSAVGRDASADGGTGGRDAVVVTVKLDVISAWYGESDALQEPDLPPAPTADANCGIITSDTTRQPVDVLLVLDRSGSMDYSIGEDCYCTSGAAIAGSVCTDTTNCTTRWNSIKPAVTTTLSTSKYVNWGLKFFSTPNGSSCNVSKAMEVPISETSAAAVQTQVDTATLSLGTPTAAAISAATAYLKTVTDPNKKFILLATDGEPNCGGNPVNINTTDVPGATSASKAAFDAGFPVYVIGIGPSVSTLTQLAQAGGTTDFYPATSSQQLSDALSAISKKVGSCLFTATQAPPDSGNIAVYVNKQQIAQDPNEGWTYGASPQEIVLKGSYCDKITAGEDTNVQILFGCPGAPPFPPFVP